MKRLITLLAVLMAAVLLASTAMAQSATGTADATETPVAEEEATPAPEEEATPAPEEEAADAAETPEAVAEEVTDEASAAFITMNLTAGYAMDPFFVSVEGGGMIDASTLGEGCTGFVNEAPAVTVDWEGEADFVEAFYLSDHDPVMVIETPGGEFLCADDANEVLLDPVIEITDPEQGVYNIWIGTFDEGQRFPGVLVITTRQEVNIGTFSLAGLVRRGTIPEDHLEAEELRPSDQADIAAGNARVQTEALEEGTDTLTADITVEGEFPAFDIELDELICNGYVPTEPNFAFTEDGNAELLRVFFESDQDSTLIVLGPDDQVWCNDDAEAGVNLNPLIDIPTPPAGDYFVYVGRLGLEEPVSGTLTVTELADNVPANLGPPNAEGGSN